MNTTPNAHATLDSLADAFRDAVDAQAISRVEREGGDTVTTQDVQRAAKDLLYNDVGISEELVGLIFSREEE